MRRQPVLATVLALLCLPLAEARAQSVLLQEGAAPALIAMPEAKPDEKPQGKTTTPTKAPEKKPCKTNCGTVAEGFEWASNKGIASSTKCPEGSDEFISGCKQFVEELLHQSANMERSEKGLPPLPKPIEAAVELPKPAAAEEPPFAKTETTPEPAKPEVEQIVTPLQVIESTPAAAANTPPAKPHESTLLLSAPTDLLPVKQEDAPTSEAGQPALPDPSIPTLKRQGDGQPAGTTLSIGRVP